MNTEDDTFRKLQQSPFEVVFREISNYDPTRIQYNIFEFHHWTYDEYMVALTAYYGGNIYDRR